ncbi:FGGY-family carbohydrate kinase [Amycolatopsis taiwanensis]|uniref:FGGY-family carbohydrate kinase n=1 Tax=Amycolatopsis taiwanensis TaxID=342230 RepID=UPI000483ED3C|nr:FGGY family carbohydrate kinase [Amycolatopsis taiwanensis]
MSVVLGVDIGTYEAKGVLVDESGRIVARHQRPHRVTVPRPGYVEHDPEAVWWNGFVEITRALLAAHAPAAGAVAAVAVSGIGPCVLPLDSSGAPLRNAILYGVDVRAAAQIDQLTDAAGEQEILERAGTSLTSQSAGPKIAWIEQNEPEIFARTALFVTCQTFITGRLTGNWVIDQATAAYYHPFYDRRTADWNLDGCPGALTRAQLPEIGWSCDIAGLVTRAAAETTGLPAGTPVLVGAPDAAAEALSAGVSGERDMMVMYGSSHFMIEVLDAPHTSRVLWPAPYLFRDTYLLAAGTATAGSFTRWFADLLSPDTGGDDALYTELAELAAASPPGARGLLALPYLSGERTPLYDPGARGALFGLSLRHDRGDVARAIAESIAHSAAAALRAFDVEGLSPKVVRAVGGGTRNLVWVQAVSDISGYPQDVVAGPGAALGDAMLAGMAAGLLDGPDDSRRWVAPARLIEPRREFAELYDRQRDLFEQLYRGTRPIVSALDELRNQS